MFSASTKAASGTVPAIPDPQFNYVTMLLHGDGTNGAQNNTFLDSSTNNFTITRNGNTTQGSFSPYGSNWSNYFDGGTSTGLQTPTSTNLNLTGDFTIECWFNFTSTAGVYSAIWTCGNGLFNLESAISYNYPVADAFNFNVQGANIVSSNAISLNTWYHIAITRSGSTTRMFINGSIVSTSTASYTITDATVYPNTIGNRVPSAPSANYPFYGYISNFRIVKGTAVYTSAFTPSTTPLTVISGTALLTCADNRFIDDSANNFIITANGTPSVQRFNPFGTATAYSTSVIGGSGYFDNSGDYLDAPTNNAAFQFGTGDFTVECWVYQNATNSYPTVLEIDNHVSNGGILFYVGTTTGEVGAYNGTTGFLGTATAPPLNTWNHIAWVRSSGTFKIYVNGVGNAGVSFTTNLNISATVTVNTNRTSGSYNLAGNISNLRLVKGTAVYTSNFTPSTAPLTAISGTSLLLPMTNGAIFDNAMMNDLETVGNAQISTSVVKYGTGSMYFDGTGDWLSTIVTPNLSFNLGDFTIEMWVYTSNLSAYQTLIDARSSNTTIAYGLFIDNTGKPYLYDASGFSLSSLAISSNTWTHLAFVRTASVFKIFVNGVSGFSGTNTNQQNPTGMFKIGRNFDGDASYLGYIDDLRITKGYARYTANFTPPIAAFPNTGPY
jgi:hypothetical protein